MIMMRLDAAQRSTRRMGEYVGGHFEQVRLAATEQSREGMDPLGPQASAMNTWLSWATAVLNELDAAHAQIMAARKIIDTGCVVTAPDAQ